MSIGHRRIIKSTKVENNNIVVIGSNNMLLTSLMTNHLGSVHLHYVVHTHGDRNPSGTSPHALRYHHGILTYQPYCENPMYIHFSVRTKGFTLHLLHRFPFMMTNQYRGDHLSSQKIE